MQSGNRIYFFLARYAPVLPKGLLARTGNTVRKHPGKYLQKTLSRIPEWDKRIMENQNGEDLIMHVTEAFRQGVDGTYRDLLLVARP